MAELLLEQLRSKYGPLTEDAVSRVRSALPERLKFWACRMLTAQTLDAALTPRPNPAPDSRTQMHQ